MGLVGGRTASVVRSSRTVAFSVETKPCVTLAIFLPTKKDGKLSATAPEQNNARRIIDYERVISFFVKTCFDKALLRTAYNSHVFQFQAFMAKSVSQIHAAIQIGRHVPRLTSCWRLA